MFQRHAVVATLFVVVTLAAFIASGTVNAAPPPTPLNKSKTFYLTRDFFTGSQAKTACAAGYHMASIWEIADPSNLTYDTTLGLTQDDSASGPPSRIIGWVRTGDVSLSGRNCSAWTSSSNDDSGLTVYLNSAFDQTPSTLGAWLGDVRPCDEPESGVWCVSN